MKNKLSAAFQTFNVRLLGALLRFPETVAFAILTSGMLVFLHHAEFHLESPLKEYLYKIVMLLILGGVISLCKTVLFERIFGSERGAPWWLHGGYTVLLLALLTGYFFWLPTEPQTVDFFHYGGLLFIFLLAFFFIPHRLQTREFEKYILYLVWRFAVTYVFALILLAGGSAILLTVDALFSPVKDLSDLLVPDLFIVLSGIFTPLFFLAYVPRYGETMDEMQYPQLLQLLLKAILLPLLTVYIAILYVYMSTILISMEWPKGVVTNLVLWFSILSMIILFFTLPLRKQSRWADLFCRWFPLALWPMLVMMFVSVGIRISAYGVTESRYLVCAAGVWVALVVGFFLFKREPRTVWLPISLALFVFIATLSPMNAVALSIYDQNERFETILERYGLLKDGKLIKADKQTLRNITESDRVKLLSVLNYFDWEHGLHKLRALPPKFDYFDIEQWFGFSTAGTYVNGQQTQYFNYVLQEQSALDVNGFDKWVNFSDYSNEPRIREMGPLLLTYSPADKRLTVTKDKQTLQSFALLPTMKNIRAKHPNESTLSAKQMSTTFESASFDLMIVYTSIAGTEKGFEMEQTFEYPQFYVLLKFK